MKVETRDVEIEVVETQQMVVIELTEREAHGLLEYLDRVSPAYGSYGYSLRVQLAEIGLRNWKA